MMGEQKRASAGASASFFDAAAGGIEEDFKKDLNRHDVAAVPESAENGGIPEEYTAIERVGAENEVMEMVLEDRQFVYIVNMLKEKYAESGENFTTADLKKFVQRNRGITAAVIQADRDLAERHVQANFLFKNKLMDMQSICYEAMEGAANEKEYGAIANLHNAILKNMHLFARLSGHLDGPQNEVNINVGTDVAKIVSDKMAAGRDDFLKQVKIIDIDPEEEAISDSKQE